MTLRTIILAAPATLEEECQRFDYLTKLPEGAWKGGGSSGRDVGRLPSRHCLELNTHLIEQIIGEWSAADPATRKAALEYLRRHAEAKGCA